jgi:hypothetical protein
LINGAERLDFQRTLYAGRYNLLFGSGISLGSKNGKGDTLQAADDLRRRLCGLKSVPDRTTLARVASLLTDDEAKNELIRPFQNCVPDLSLYPFTSYLWQRAFTFNIDDVVEKLYDRPDSKQIPTPINYDDPFEPTPDHRNIQIIHLHGWVGKPASRLVFSRNEYAQVMRSMNPWMHLLSEILATEPFIIAGTSLDEPDLEYYLSYRNTITPRRGRGPSLLIEPFPNAITEADCARHGLILVKATFGEFLKWLRAEYPLPPTISELLLPQTVKLFEDTVQPSQVLRFYSDFQALTATEEPLPDQPSRFLAGREPSWEDISRHVDVERSDNAIVAKAVEMAFADRSRPALIMLADEPGTGKTTTIKRVAHSSILSGKVALTVATVSRIDVKNAIACLAEAVSPILLLVDGLADHAEQIAEILEAKDIKVRLVVLACERSYRLNYVEVTAGHLRRTERKSTPFTLPELEQVIERYRVYGLLADKGALRDPKAFSRQIQREPIAIAICRLLNDFRPLQSIVESLWQAAAQIDRTAYVCTALAHYCYAPGANYSVLQTAVGLDYPLATLFNQDKPLRISENADREDFVVPLNSVIAERILRHVVTNAPEILQICFKQLATSLAPHVNRGTVMKRTPESRLAGRLFDADKVARPLLGWAAEQFYVDVAEDWRWNSRYWEQRALLILDTRPDDALSYARHAVAIEKHPHPLTTLGKVLIAQMGNSPSSLTTYFTEAFATLSEAINSEARQSRVTIHPYFTLFAGTARFLERGGSLSGDQRATLLQHLSASVKAFPHDTALRSHEQQVKQVL